MNPVFSLSRRTRRLIAFTSRRSMDSICEKEKGDTVLTLPQQRWGSGLISAEGHYSPRLTRDYFWLQLHAHSCERSGPRSVFDAHRGPFVRTTVDRQVLALRAVSLAAHRFPTIAASRCRTVFTGIGASGPTSQAGRVRLIHILLSPSVFRLHLLEQREQGLRNHISVTGQQICCGTTTNAPVPHPGDRRVCAIDQLQPEVAPHPSQR